MKNSALTKIAERAEGFGLSVEERVETTSYGANIHMVEFRRPKVETKTYLDLFNNADCVVLTSWFNESTKRWNTDVTRYSVLDPEKLKQRSVDFYIRLFADAI